MAGYDCVDVMDFLVLYTEYIQGGSIQSSPFVTLKHTSGQHHIR